MTEPEHEASPDAAEAGKNPEADSANTDRSQNERSAAQDLADGLDLMLRAAKKAVRHVDPQNIEALGRRALGNLEALNKKRVEEVRRKAKHSLDPRRIEEIAEEAGRELWRVVERVAERVDSVVARPGAPPQSTDQAAPSREPEASSPEHSDGEGASGPKRVRIEDE